MRKLLTTITLASLMSAPVQAAGDALAEVRPGAFVGARVKLALGGGAPTRPHAALMIAPTQSRISDDGMVRTRIGEGVALNFAGGEKSSLTIGGKRPDADKGLGISTGGWIAIGVGTVVVAGGIAFALWVDAIEDNSD